MHKLRGLAAVVLLLTIGSCPVVAQTHTQRIVGHILDEATAAPISEAFVQLIDSTGAVRAATLSHADGLFILDAPVPGRYTLRAERIGYANSISDTLAVSPGATLRYRFPVRARAIRLGGLKVTATSRCRISRKLAATTRILWDEARKALEIVRWTEKSEGVPFQSASWTRALDLASLKLVAGDRRLSSVYGQRPFQSASPQDLAIHGFVREEGDSMVIVYGLDAQALLSNAFLGGHCFRAVEPHREAANGLIGLEFKPLNQSGPPDIDGTLWLDRKTFELRYLEFEYTGDFLRLEGVPFPLRGVPRSRFGGRVDFARLNNGAWVVSKWRVRMASWGPPRGRLRIREQGGEIAFAPHLAPSSGARTAAIEGTVYDSVDAEPVVGATVFLADDYTTATTTDRLGRFRLDSLPPGHHVIAFLHPFTDSLDLLPITRPVFLQADHDTHVALAIPKAAGCPPSSDEGGIVGFVQGAADGTPLAGVPIEVACVQRHRLLRSWETPSFTHPCPSG